jgi:hypothetical protein
MFTTCGCEIMSKIEDHFGFFFSFRMINTKKLTRENEKKLKDVFPSTKLMLSLK